MVAKKEDRAGVEYQNHLYYDSAYEPNVPMNTYNKIRLVQRCDPMNDNWIIGKIAVQKFKIRVATTMVNTIFNVG